MNDVSVIIPTFQREKYIRRAILSVINQHNVSCEIIVVDDNGLNSSCQIALQKKIQDLIDTQKIRYIIHKKNAGGSVSRNSGINVASGEYLAFLDDDDWFETNKLSLQIEYMKREKTDACLCGFCRIYSDRTVTVSDPGLLVNESKLKKSLLSQTIDTCAGSCLVIKKSLVERVGLFDVSFIRHQDLEFLYRISKETRISVVPCKLVNIFMHADNLSVKSGENIEKYRLHYVNKFLDDIMSLPDADRRSILNRHYVEIAKAYIKNKNFSKAFHWVFQTTNPMASIRCVVREGFHFLFRMGKSGNKKREGVENEFIRQDN